MTTILSAEDRGKLEEAIRIIESKDHRHMCDLAHNFIRSVLDSSTPPTETEEDRELRRLAEAVGDGWYNDAKAVEETMTYSRVDAEFITFTNPKRILSLLDRLAGKEK